ncbi:hypothetical protein B0H13DRAFT_2306040 [Mycena leptocephala]|nr:hypothetical protein B0H13DRAFT_2306040 [Mycena leptocephala]
MAAQNPPPTTFNWGVPNVSVPIPSSRNPIAKAPPPLEDLEFTPVGAYDVRRHLGAAVPHFNRLRHRYTAADLIFLAAGACEDGRHVVPADEFFPEPARAIGDKCRRIMFDLVRPRLPHFRFISSNDEGGPPEDGPIIEEPSDQPAASSSTTPSSTPAAPSSAPPTSAARLPGPPPPSLALPSRPRQRRRARAGRVQQPRGALCPVLRILAFRRPFLGDHSHSRVLHAALRPVLRIFAFWHPFLGSHSHPRVLQAALCPALRIFVFRPSFFRQPPRILESSNLHFLGSLLSRTSIPIMSASIFPTEKMDSLLALLVPEDARKEGGSRLRNIFDVAARIGLAEGLKRGEESVLKASKTPTPTLPPCSVSTAATQTDLPPPCSPAVPSSPSQPIQKPVETHSTTQTEVAASPEAAFPRRDVRSPRPMYPQPSLSQLASQTFATPVSAPAAAVSESDILHERPAHPSLSSPTPFVRDFSAGFTFCEFATTPPTTRTSFTRSHTNFLHRDSEPGRTRLTSYPHPSKCSTRPTRRPPQPLEWDRDPRLRDLSRALSALGWVRPR